MKDWPRLTETLPATTTLACRKCGEADEVKLQLWQEHDEKDNPERRYLWLCRRCSDAIVEPHPRLYAQISNNAPAPGAMRICFGCSFADSTRCTNPAAKQNGGAPPGIILKVSPPLTAMVDGVRNGKRTGWRETMYFHPPSHCNGRNPPV